MTKLQSLCVPFAPEIVAYFGRPVAELPAAALLTWAAARIRCGLPLFAATA